MHRDHFDSEFARILLSDERRRWQDPDRIISQLRIEKDFQICDLGCGPGFFTLAFARKVGSKGKVFAVDSSPKMLEVLRAELIKNRIRNVELICSDVTSTGLPGNSMDIAFFANVLHDIDDKPAFLAEVRRICKKEAQVVNIDWKKDQQSNHGPPDHMRLDEEEALKIFEKEGFRLERTIDGGSYHYGLLFRVE
ncbi:MAG: class I SAM-dependent methyltransferase [Conexivisphaerales archaeon]